MKGHLKHMLIAGAGVLLLLLVLGVDLGRALPWALLLACPLMMVGMMRTMNHGHGASHTPPAEEVGERDGAGEHQHR